MSVRKGKAPSAHRALCAVPSMTDLSLIVESLPEQRVLQISSNGELVLEPEMSGEERNIRVLQQLPLATLLSRSVDEEEDAMEEADASGPARPPATVASHGAPTPELMGKLAAAHAEAEQAVRLVAMLQEQRHLKLQHIADPPFRAQPDPPAVSCSRKRKQMSASGAALSRDIEELRSLLRVDRRVHTEVTARRSKQPWMIRPEMLHRPC